MNAATQDNKDTAENKGDATKPNVKEPKPLTAADAAKLVKRTVIVPPEKEGGKPTTKSVAITEAEVLSFKDYGDYVVVVTTDGQKFTGTK